MSYCCLWSQDRLVEKIEPQACFAPIFRTKVKNVYLYILPSYKETFDANGAELNKLVDNPFSQEEIELYFTLLSQIGFSIELIKDHNLHLSANYDKSYLKTKCTVIKLNCDSIDLSQRNLFLTASRFVYESPFQKVVKNFLRWYNETKGKYPIHWYLFLAVYTSDPYSGHSFGRGHWFFKLYKTDKDFMTDFKGTGTVSGVLKTTKFSQEIQTLLTKEESTFKKIITKFFELCQEKSTL